MNHNTQKIWKVFCGELIDNGEKDSEDVRQALSTALKELVNEYQYYNPGDGEDMIIDARILYDLATEL